MNDCRISRCGNGFNASAAGAASAPSALEEIVKTLFSAPKKGCKALDRTKTGLIEDVFQINPETICARRGFFQTPETTKPV